MILERTASKMWWHKKNGERNEKMDKIKLFDICSVFFKWEQSKKLVRLTEETKTAQNMRKETRP